MQWLTNRPFQAPTRCFNGFPSRVSAQIRPWHLCVVGEAIHATVCGIRVGHEAKFVYFDFLVALTNEEHELPRFPSGPSDGHAVDDALGKAVNILEDG